MNRIRKIAAGGAFAAATIAGGALGASFLGTANAQTDSSSSSDSSTTSAQPSIPAHGTPEHEALETPVTGDAATQAQSAAVASVGEGTAGDVTTDARGNGYEVTVTKSDGSQVEVHLDSSFNVVQGHGGGRGGGGGPHSANGVTETPLTGDDLAKATSAAQTAEPGATVDRAETDADGDAYEVHMTLADGSHVTVKLDSSFNVTSTADGHG
jgi:hypothetical protein